MNYQIIDNFLEEEDFKTLKEYLLGPKITWSYGSYKVDKHINHNNPYDFQFTHVFWVADKESEHFDLLKPIFDKLKPKGYARTKANLTGRTPDRVIYGMHTDYRYPMEKMNTAVFYVNTNDGLTIFENGDTVESIENRILIFDNGMLHTGTSCTDEKVRCVININYLID